MKTRCRRTQSVSLRPDFGRRPSDRIRSSHRSATTSRRRRPAFTLLEVLIALGILGTLLTIIWSMMANFQTLEQRGMQRTHKSRALRSLHDALHSDFLHLSRFQRPSSPTPPSPPARDRRDSTPTTIPSLNFSTLTGDANGFQMTMLVASNPIPVLDATLQAGDNPPWLPHTSLEPPRARVFYSLEEEPAVPQGEPLYRLRRKVVMLPDRLQQAMQTPRELPLSSRSNSNPDSNVVVLETSFGFWETTWDHLVSPQFRYFNGQDWVTQWNAADAPAAIEFSFNFESNLQRREREAAEQEAIRTERPLETEPNRMPLNNQQETIASEEIPLRDVRLVIAGVSR